MTRRYLALMAGAVLALTGCTGTAEREPPARRDGSTTGTGSPGDREPLARLRNGGLTIVIRHATTDQDKPDAATVDLADCSTQRNLSVEGRSDAREIGAAIGRLGIPIGKVWASPYCRSRDTAKLAFGRFEVVDGLERLYPDRDEQADSRLNRLIRERAPRTGQPNLVIAGHGVYPSVLAPPVTLAEGEAAVYARSAGGFGLVDRIEPDEWDDFAPAVRHPNAAAARVSESVVALAGQGGEGAAFQVAVPGILVTAGRLVGSAREVTVTRPDGRRLKASVLGRDSATDIAALRIERSALAPLHSGSGLAEARTGDRVHAVGAAGVVTAGSIRSLGDRILVDADIPRASAGGPLIDQDGYVLGVLTASPGGGLDAVPVDVARAAALAIVRGSQQAGNG